jgi:hypothetical protein
MPRWAVVWTIAIGLPLVAAVFLRWDYNRRAPVNLLYRIGWENDPPYELRSEDGSPAGLAVELIGEAASLYEPEESMQECRIIKLLPVPVKTITSSSRSLR